MPITVNSQPPSPTQIAEFLVAFGIVSQTELAEAIAALNTLTPEQSAALAALMAGTAAAVDSVARGAANNALLLAQNALSLSDADIVDEELTTLMPSDQLVLYRGGLPFNAQLSTLSTYLGAVGAPTAPGAIADLDWGVVDTAVPGQVEFSFTGLPSDGGSPLTALEYRVDTGTPIALVGTGLGTRLVSAGFTAGAASDVQVRAVNAIDAGPWSSIKSVTPAASTGTADFVGYSYTPVSAGTTTITRPAGATAGHTLVAIMFSAGSATPTTQAAPTDWSPGTGVTVDGKGSRVFTAAGDVATLEFNTTGASGILCFAVSGALRAGYGYTGYYWENNPGADAPTPAITAEADDCIVSAYIQVDLGAAGGVDVFSGTDQAGYTSRLQMYTEATPPFISILSRAGVTAGSTGTISHGVNANFSTRFCFTGAFA